MNIKMKGMLLTILMATMFVFAGTVVEAKDMMEPSVEISGPNEKTIKEGGSVQYYLSAVDNVGVKSFNVTGSHIVLHNFTANVSISGSNLGMKTVTLSNIRSSNDNAQKYISVLPGTAKDLEGNADTDTVYSAIFSIEKAETKPVQKDTMEPSVEIKGPSSKSIVAGGTVSYTITATDNVGVATFSLNSSYIEMKGFTANISISGNTVTFSNVRSNSSTATKYIVVKAGAAVDATGNKSEAVTSGAFTMTEAKDTMEPSVEIGGPTPKTVDAGGSVTYKITAVDNVKVDKLLINSDYVQMVGFTASMKVNGSNVTFSNIKSTNNSAQKYIVVKAGAAIDTAGNKSEAVTSGTFTINAEPVKPVEKDTVAPIVSIGNASPAGVYEGEKVTYIVTFSDNKAVTEVNLTTKDIKLNGFTADISVSGSGFKTRTVTLTNIKGSVGSNCSITVAKGVIKDAAGNVNVAVTSPKFSILKKTTPVDKDTVAPIVSIGNASPSGVYRGGKVTYVVTFSDNKAVTEVNLTAKDIKLNGFTANISVSGSGLKTRTITLTNIKGNVGSGYSITIAKGVIKDAEGNINVAVTSPRFSILKSATTVKPSEVVSTTIKGNCIDDLSLLGDINDEITYFSSWLRAEKYTASYVQENNYVADDERMTYMVEYYNGSTAPSPDVKFTLTIPYKVDVEEINGNGYIKSRTDKETIIEWDMGKISSKAYCRLYVRVKFNEDSDLLNSKDISRVFYATLKTTAGGNTSYSYMRQLYIDKTEGKTGTYKSYLAAIDNTNSIRPEDKITRAEFAKLLADCGIVKGNASSTAYKEYKDWETIPVYARAAVAALSDTDIIQAFPDGTFKPNNPILMEDAIQMVAQAATYISDTKLTVVKPTFLYKNALKDSFGDITDKKDYIMELMRQNVIVKYESTPDEYALRKDVVSIVNALTFRGPYVEKLPANAIKFADVRDDSVYFYNFVGAANSYSYTYDYRLWQEIVEIQ